MSDDIIRGSGNVLADLDLDEAEELSAKVKLAVTLNRILERRGLKQVAAAKVLGIPQAKVSLLKNYKLDGFSVEKLMTLLTRLGRDVEIRISKRVRSKGPGRISVAA